MTAAGISGPIVAAGISGLIVAAALFRERLMKWTPRRRKPEPSADWCATCLRDLPRGDVWEIRELQPPTGDEEGAGGSYLAQTFCREHAPRGAVRT